MAVSYPSRNYGRIVLTNVLVGLTTLPGNMPVTYT